MRLEGMCLILKSLSLDFMFMSSFGYTQSTETIDRQGHSVSLLMESVSN